MFEPLTAGEASQQERLQRVAAQLSTVHARMGLDDPRQRLAAFPVADDVAAVVGQVTRGSVVSVQGSTSVALRMIALASQQGEWLAVVGAPEVGMVAAARCGVDLSRVVMIPDPAHQTAEVLGACIVGMRMVMVGPVTMNSAQRRRLATMARESRTILVALAPWEGAALDVRARPRVEGLGAGHGRVVGQRIEVAVRRRGSPWRHELLEWIPDTLLGQQASRTQPLAAG